MTATTAIALLIATAVPLVALYLIYTQDLYGTGAFSTVIACFIWGVAAYGIAYTLRMTALANVEYYDYVRYVAPIAEEILKALILFVLVRRRNFTYFVDGAIYGFAIGIGFAVIENYEYVLSWNDPLSAAVSRVISSNLMHATASAILGISFGIARLEKSQARRILTIVTGFAVAMAVHVGFNNLVTRVSSGFLLLYGAVVGVGGTFSIIMMMQRGLAEQKTWIQETLGEADRVTSREAAVVDKLDQAEEFRTVMERIAQQFGEQKADQIEKFLLLQAQLGIKRKTLDLLPDEKQRQNVREQMDELRQEMDKARKAVGTYCMLYLRNIFPEDGIASVWGKLDRVVGERSITASDTSVADLMQELSSVQRRIITLLLHNDNQLSHSQLSQILGSGYEADRLSQVEIDEALEFLSTDRYIIRMGEDNVVYKANLGRRVQETTGKGDIWSSLGQRATHETASDRPDDDV